VSDIPRYRPVANDKYGITDDVDGKLCEYRDYARLKAEFERLTKAGDAMANRTEFFQKRWDANELCQEVEDWNKAKQP
jgi:hypothetical protein